MDLVALIGQKDNKKLQRKAKQKETRERTFMSGAFCSSRLA